jgi:hypothetical protein
VCDEFTGVARSVTDALDGQPHDNGLLRSAQLGGDGDTVAIAVPEWTTTLS